MRKFHCLHSCGPRLRARCISIIRTIACGQPKRVDFGLDRICSPLTKKVLTMDELKNQFDEKTLESYTPDELNRLWSHGLHEESLFYDRLNYFTAMQVGLLGVFAILYNKDPSIWVFMPLTV